MTMNQAFSSVVIIMLLISTIGLLHTNTNQVTEKIIDDETGMNNSRDDDFAESFTGKAGLDMHNRLAKLDILDKNDSSRADFTDYPELTTELQTIAASYPNITGLYDLGQSVQGRTIWGLKITDNPDIEEAEPEIRFDGCHHGNEYMSVEMPLLFAWHLVENYSVDPTVTDYVDNIEIWIVPMINPDGRQMSQRYNANYVDLNRDYGYMWSGAGSSSSPFSQPETQVMREHGMQNNIVISYSYHTTAEYVNYVWDYKPQPSPDEPWIDMISQGYADLSGYEKTNGYDWYQTTGASDDGNYGCFSNINTIIETLNSNIADEWDRNRDAMMYALDVVDMGLSGFVTDAETGDPIAASIWVEENNWPVFTDPRVGDYYKPLFEGTYHVHFRANGYEEQTKIITITDANASNMLNASLQPSNNHYAYQVTMCEYVSHYSNPSEGISALGPPDNVSASLDDGGMTVLDMGNTTWISNGTGDDLMVYEEGDDEGYDVFVSDQWSGPWYFLGSGMGTTSFDFAGSGIESIRFVKIVDDDISSFDGYPGADIDAIEGISDQLQTITVENITAGWNFISIPYVHDMQKTDILISTDIMNYTWQEAVSANLISDYLFGWNRTVQSYDFTSDFISGQGYWLYAYNDCSLLLCDLVVESDKTITQLQSGWNTLGINGLYMLAKEDVQLIKDMNQYSWNEAVALGYVNNYMFTWNATNQLYEFSSQLTPGLAYWLYATTDLTMNY